MNRWIRLWYVWRQHNIRESIGIYEQIIAQSYGDNLFYKRMNAVANLDRLRKKLKRIEFKLA